MRPIDWRWLLAVTVLALLVRLAVATQVTPDPRDGRFDDSVWYDTAARHLAAGDGYVFDPTVWRTADGNPIYPGETALTPTALWPPGYPLTLAAIYKATDNSVTAGRMANVVFGTLTVALVFLIARRLFDLTAAALAGGALAIFPAHVLFTSVLLSETYFGFLLALVLAIFVYFVANRDDPNILAVALVGALTAATGYVRGEFLLYGCVFALIMLFQLRRDALLPLVTLALGALLVIVPWTLRNNATMGEPIVGTTGAGRVMYQGHNPKTDGGPSLLATWELENRHPGVDRKTLELRVNEDGSRLAREWALDHKLKELELVGRRMYLLFKTDEAGVTWLQSNKPWFSQEGADRLVFASTFWFYALVALALAAAPLWWRPRDGAFWAVFGIVPYYMLTFGVLFIGDPRYHYAMYIPLAIFGGRGLAALARLTVDQRRDLGPKPLLSPRYARRT